MPRHSPNAEPQKRRARSREEIDRTRLLREASRIIQEQRQILESAFREAERGRSGVAAHQIHRALIKLQTLDAQLLALAVNADTISDQLDALAL